MNARSTERAIAVRKAERPPTQRYERAAEPSIDHAPDVYIITPTPELAKANIRVRFLLILALGGIVPIGVNDCLRAEVRPEH